MPAELHQTTWCADMAIDFIKEDRGRKPWMFSLNCFDPHPPYDPAYADVKFSLLERSFDKLARTTNIGSWTLKRRY